MPEPRRITFVLHHAKVQVHRLVRWLDDRAAPIERASVGRSLIDAPLVGEDRSRLWNHAIDPREWPLERGKLENLRVAARALNGLEFAAGQVFSFWAQVGPPLRVRGFVEGRELREGCVVPGVGGGLCLLSNGVFAAAKRAGLAIVERHPHSRRPPGSRAELGEDATVAWNYVDLRVRADRAWRLEVELSADELHVRVRARASSSSRRSLARVDSSSAAWAGESGPSCRSCDQPCFRAAPPRVLGRREPALGRRVWLLDAVWPEYAAWLREQARVDDRLAIPIDGRLLGRERYAWPRVDVAERMQFPVEVLLRSLHSRALADQGAARQRALLGESERLARAMAARLRPDDVELIVAQELLPFLWRLGALGGRELTVLMQRLPLADLHAQLDRAARAHPESPTLADFRADRELLADEARALDHAARIVTPHAEIARRFGERALHLRWALPGSGADSRAHARASRRPGLARVWLPAGSVGRKGAYELREAVKGMRLNLRVSGRELEGPRFWSAASGIEVVHGPPDSLADLDLALLPAWVEHAPRALLRAVAAGVPVIASRSCGLAGIAGVIEVPTGDVESLRTAIAAVLETRTRARAFE
ncbi:VanW family protein [Nannocystaceae bacterium ST9]